MRVQQVEKALAKRGVKKRGEGKMVVSERHIHLDSCNYVFCMETCALVTRKFNGVSWSSEFLVDVEDVCDALLMKVELV